jgi:hypothetical protein
MIKYIVIAVIVIITLIALLFLSVKEPLSLSQWMPQQDCSCFIKKPAEVLPEYSKDTKIDCSLTPDRRLRLKNCDFYNTFKDETSCSGCGGCASCKASKVLYPIEPCFQLTPDKHNPTTLALPPVPEKVKIVYTTTVKNMSKDMIRKFLRNGDIIVSAKSLNVIDYLINKLKYPGGNGYPDFYKVDGPVTVVTRYGEGYYYMIDYPIKYTPENIENYVNTVESMEYAVDAWTAGTRLQQSCDPVIVLRA